MATLRDDTDGRNETNVPKTTSSVRGTFSEEKADVIATVARHLRSMSAAPMDPRLKSILASQVGYLLGGGFDVALVRSTAINLLPKVQELANIGAHVRTAQAEVNNTEDVARRLEAERSAFGEATREAARAFLAAKKHERYAVPTVVPECVECKQLTDGRCEKCGTAVHPKVCSKRHRCAA